MRVLHHSRDHVCATEVTPERWGTRLTSDGWTADKAWRAGLVTVEQADAVPDLDDGPTKGALIELVREFHKAPFAQVTPWLRFDGERPPINTGWRVCLNDAMDTELPARPTQPAPTEGEALALALLAVKP
jgi:hypothetical protein